MTTHCQYCTTTLCEGCKAKAQNPTWSRPRLGSWFNVTNDNKREDIFELPVFSAYKPIGD